MARENLDLGVFDKVEGLLSTAMKTDVAKAKEREGMRKKALDQLKEFKTKYAARMKLIKSDNIDSLDDLENAEGIAEQELKSNHPLVVDLTKAIAKYKATPVNTDYEKLDKAMNAIGDWDVSSEKPDSLKEAIGLLDQAQRAYLSRRADYEKLADEKNKLIKAARKDLDSVDDEDVKKKLKKILDTFPT